MLNLSLQREVRQALVWVCVYGMLAALPLIQGPSVGSQLSPWLQKMLPTAAFGLQLFVVMLMILLLLLLSIWCRPKYCLGLKSLCTTGRSQSGARASSAPSVCVSDPVSQRSWQGS